MRKIGKYCSMSVGQDSVIVIIKDRIDVFIALVVVMSVLVLIGYTKNYLLKTEYLFFLVIAFLLVIYSAGLTVKYDIYFSKCSVKVQKKFLGLQFKESVISWDKTRRLCYEIKYDSYENVSAVCLVASVKDKPKNKKKLVEFYDMETFNDFRKILRRERSSVIIGEWYE